MQVGERCAKVHVLLLVEGIAAEPQGDRRFLDEPVGDVLHGRIELVVRHHSIDDAEGLHLVRGPPVAEHLHLQQHLARDAPRQDRLDHHRPDPDVDLWRAECRGVNCDQQVARARKAQAAGQRVAVDAADDGLARLRHQREELDEQVAAAMALEVRHASVEAGEVGACAEHTVARAGEDDDAHIGLVPAPPERSDEVPQHLAGKGVALVRAVQRDRGYVAIHGEKGLFQRRCLSQRCPYRRGRVRIESGIGPVTQSDAKSGVKAIIRAELTKNK